MTTLSSVTGSSPTNSPGVLLKNVVNRSAWDTRNDLSVAIVFWIESTYHRRRRQDDLGRFTPVEFEAVLQTAHAARPPPAEASQPE